MLSLQLLWDLVFKLFWILIILPILRFDLKLWSRKFLPTCMWIQYPENQRSHPQSQVMKVLNTSPYVPKQHSCADHILQYVSCITCVPHRETLWTLEMPAQLPAGAGLVRTTINLDALTEDTRVQMHLGKVMGMGGHKHKPYGHLIVAISYPYGNFSKKCKM